MAKLRLFIAFELPEPMLAEIERARSRLRSRTSIPLKWVRAESSHLTLKFLGYVEEERVPGIHGAMRTVAEDSSAFRLSLGSLGTFGGSRQRVLWVGLEGELDKLIKLQRALDRELAALGFEPEVRPFHPHLTLARVPERLDRSSCEELRSMVASSQRPRSVAVDFSELSLMQSTLKREGAEYTRLSSVALAGNSDSA